MGLNLKLGAVQKHTAPAQKQITKLRIFGAVS